jgi:hypothetical protein
MARKQQDNAPALGAQPAYKVVKREKDRWWKVRDPRGELVCVTVYKRGAVGGTPARGVTAGRSSSRGERSPRLLRCNW